MTASEIDIIAKTVLIHLTKKTKKDFDEATELLAKYIENAEHIYTIRNDKISEVWIYIDGIYEPHGKTHVKEILRQILTDAYRNTIYNAVIVKIEADTFIDQEVFFRDDTPYLLPVKNGLLELKSQKLIPFDSKYKFFNKINATYNPKAKCPAIIKFFESILKDEDDITTMQEIYGFCLVREYFLEKAIMFIGEGRNGKSKTVELLKRFLNASNCANISLQALEKDNFAMAELHNKMANLSADISDEAIQHTGNFKSLTGRDLISASRKFLPRVNFVNYAKMIFCANQLPITHDESLAFFNRWVLIEFIYKFLSQKEHDTLTDEDVKRYKLEDPAIIEKIITEEEMSGLLNWALEGLSRLLRDKDFSLSSTAKEIKNTWLRLSNSVRAFGEDCIIADVPSYIPKQVFKVVYLQYCQKKRLKPLTTKSIKYTLEILYGAYEDRKYIGQERPYCWCGIKFKDSARIDYDIDSIKIGEDTDENADQPKKPKKT